MTSSSLMTKLLTDYFRWLVGAVVAIVLVAGYLIILVPKLTELRTTTVSDRAQAQATLKSEQDYATALESSVQRFHQVLPDTQLQKINDFLPSTADFPGLLLTLKNVAQAANLSLDSMTVGQVGQLAGGAASGAKAVTAPTAQAATVSGAGIQTQDVTAVFSGGSSYDQFKSLLQTIESSQRLFDIVSLSFSSGAANAATSATTNSWTMVLRTYYLPAKS